MLESDQLKGAMRSHRVRAYAPLTHNLLPAVKIPTPSTGVDTSASVASSLHDVSLASASGPSSERSDTSSEASFEHQDSGGSASAADISVPFEIVGQERDDDELGQFLLQAFDEFEHSLDAVEHSGLFSAV